MSGLDDPRVLFAAERTLLAWSRTAAGLMALGFFVDRASLVFVAGGPHRKFAAWISIAFLLLGVVLSILSVVQYRRSVASLRKVEIPRGYWQPRGGHQPGGGATRAASRPLHPAKHLGRRWASPAEHSSPASPRSECRPQSRALSKRSARSLGIKLAQPILVRADRVIE